MEETTDWKKIFREVRSIRNTLDQDGFNASFYRLNQLEKRVTALQIALSICVVAIAVLAVVLLMRSV